MALELLKTPFLEFDEDSEIEATIDTHNIGIDGYLRPILLNQNTDFFELTIADAKRLLKFLNETMPYLESVVGKPN